MLFTAIAARTGLGRSTLYCAPTIRAVIEQHCHSTADSGSLPGLTDEIITLRTKPSTDSPTKAAATTNNSDASKHETAEPLPANTPRTGPI